MNQDFIGSLQKAVERKLEAATKGIVAEHIKQITEEIEKERLNIIAETVIEVDSYVSREQKAEVLQFSLKRTK